MNRALKYPVKKLQHNRVFRREMTLTITLYFNISQIDDLIHTVSVQQSQRTGQRLALSRLPVRRTVYFAKWLLQIFYVLGRCQN